MLGLLVCCTGSLSLSKVLLLTNEQVSLINSLIEILVVGKDSIEINDFLVKESTSNDWRKFLTELFMNCMVNVISDKCFSIVRVCDRLELSDINLWEIQYNRCILHIVHLLGIALTRTHLVAHSLSSLSATSDVLWLTNLLLLVGH